MYVALCKVSDDGKDKVLLYATPEGSVGSWQTESEALAYFEGGFRRAFGAGRNWSPAALAYAHLYRYSIVEATDEQDVRARIATSPTHLVNCRHECGGMSGFETRADASALWEKGSKPRLVPA